MSYVLCISCLTGFYIAGCDFPAERRELLLIMGGNWAMGGSHTPVEVHNKCLRDSAIV